MQIYGARKCAITKKAERFFRDRGIAYHFVDLTQRALSKGELENIRRGLEAGESLIDTESAAYKKRGMAYMVYDEAEELLADPLLLRTPVLREGVRVIVGDDEKAWKALAAELKGA
ncbi:MAG: glutaredoxin [Spirochaetales bacterium]|jgi:arsenate reductase-like glutaredoxin family protein|nr:glutaredoxin [Spirochaetales bacterium]